MGYLGKACGTRNAEQRHRAFSNLVLCGKMYKAVRCFCKQETGGVVQPNKLTLDKMGVMDETVAPVLAGNTHTKPPPPVLCWRCTKKQLFLFPWALRIMWSNWSRGNFWGFRPWRYVFGRYAGVTFEIWGGHKKLCTSITNSAKWLAN